MPASLTSWRALRKRKESYAIDSGTPFRRLASSAAERTSSRPATSPQPLLPETLESERSRLRVSDVGVDVDEAEGFVDQPLIAPTVRDVVARTGHYLRQSYARK